MNKIQLLITLFLCSSLAAQAAIPQMQHRLLLADEGNGKVHCIDPADPSGKWSVTCSNRDLQLVGNDRLMVSDNGGSGWSEIDIKTGKLIRHVAVSGVSNGINSAFRLSGGETFYFNKYRSRRDRLAITLCMRSITG